MTSYRCLECVTDKQVSNITTALGGLDKVPGFDTLSALDQSKVLAKTLGGAAAAKASPKKKAKAKAAPEPAAKPAAGAGVKRKAAPSEKEQHEFLDKAKMKDFASVKALVLATPDLINVQPCGRWA